MFSHILSTFFFFCPQFESSLFSSKLCPEFCLLKLVSWTAIVENELISKRKLLEYRMKGKKCPKKLINFSKQWLLFVRIAVWKYFRIVVGLWSHFGSDVFDNRGKKLRWENGVRDLHHRSICCKNTILPVSWIPKFVSLFLKLF